MSEEIGAPSIDELTRLLNEAIDRENSVRLALSEETDKVQELAEALEAERAKPPRVVPLAPSFEVIPYQIVDEKGASDVFVDIRASLDNGQTWRTLQTFQGSRLSTIARVEAAQLLKGFGVDTTPPA